MRAHGPWNQWAWWVAFLVPALGCAGNDAAVVTASTEAAAGTTATPRPSSSVVAATPVAPSSTTSTTVAAAPAPTPRALVWADEFDGPLGQPPDAARWGFEIGGDGWGNRQLEFNDADHARLDGAGNLVIVAQPTDPATAPTCWYGPCRYVSSRLTTSGSFAPQFGRIEARLLLPGEDAAWSALWMLGADCAQVGWPTCGEIDILEHVGRWGTEISGSLHGPGYSGGDALTVRTDVAEPDRFHVYAIEWTPDAVEWSVDGRVWSRIDASDLGAGQDWVFDAPFHLVLNLAVGGTLGGEPAAGAPVPSALVIDYVRVWEPADEAAR
jgi:beta-glucanase (GH16 family)